MRRCLSAIARRTISLTSVRLAVAVVVATGALAGLVQSTPALADNATTINLWNNFNWCIDDPSDSTTPGAILQIESGCYPSAPLQGELWYTNSDSYGPGWYSLVLKNTSQGELCIDNVSGAVNGSYLEIEGCNGSAEQAWEACTVVDPEDQGYATEIVDPYGMAMDLYGDYYQVYDPIVAWGAESSAPDAELFAVPPLGQGVSCAGL
jgi:hypothetical protein